MKKIIQFSKYLLVGFLVIISCQKDDPIQYFISVQVTPAEGGSVEPSSGSYEEGETITLLATPSSEYVFKNWSGGISGVNNPTTVVMTSDKNITAVFEKKQYTLKIEVEGEGTVSEELISAKSSGDYPSGSSIKLTAVPADGWEFVSWIGDITSVENPITFTINEVKNMTAVFQPILYNQILGKWDVNNMDLIVPKNSDVKVASKMSEKDCLMYSIVFNSDGSFVLSLSSDEIEGTFYFDSSNTIVLNDHGKFDNLHINNNTLNFHLNLNNLCSLDSSADNDDDYVEGECFSFLNCNDGVVWVKQIDTGFKYVRVTNDLENVWLEHYTFDTKWSCIRKEVTNLTSEYPIILLENDLTQMTYVLDDTPDGDVTVVLNVTADNHLSVSYDYNDDLLDNVDYYDLSSQESLNEYLNSYENCPERTYVPDDNFEQALIDLGYDDVLDDYVITSIIEEITMLNLDKRDISDATGIEDFTNLTKLIISQNNLSSIDISNNINLSELQISVNNLDEIDLSQNLNLQKLFIEFNNLSAIDVSKNLELFHLAISGSPLENLDVTVNNKLERLEVNNTLLESLDVTQNTALWYLDMNNFNAEDYQHTISSIDLSNNPELTVMISNHTKLTSIDLSNNSKLEHLEIFDTQITELDVSNMNNLIRLETFFNDISCIKVNESQLNNIPEAWKKDEATTYSLDCSSCQDSLPKEGLVAYYPFNGNANDESGNENHGIVNGAKLTSGKSGVSNTAYQFNGIDNTIDLSQPFLGGGQVNSFSFHTRIKVNDSSNSPNIWGKTFYWGEVNFLINPDNSVKLRWANTVTGNKYSDINSEPNTIQINVWTDIVITYENSILKIFINGVEIESTMSWLSQGYSTLSNSQVEELCNFSQDINTSKFGMRYTGCCSPGNYFNGMIDEFAVWNRALTSQEISEFYSSCF